MSSHVWKSFLRKKQHCADGPTCGTAVAKEVASPIRLLSVASENGTGSSDACQHRSLDFGHQLVCAGPGGDDVHPDGFGEALWLRDWRRGRRGQAVCPAPVR